MNFLQEEKTFTHSTHFLERNIEFVSENGGGGGGRSTEWRSVSGVPSFFIFSPCFPETRIWLRGYYDDSLPLYNTFLSSLHTCVTSTVVVVVGL